MEKGIVESSIYPLIKDLKREQMEGKIIDAITKAMGIRGTRKDVTGAMITEIKDEILKDLKTYFRTFRIDEVVLAIEMGAKGMFQRDGDLNGVSVELIEKWIWRFAEEVRKNAFAKQRKHELDLEKAKDVERKIEGEMLLKKQITECYNRFCEGEPIEEALSFTPFVSNLMSVYFQFLEKCSLINLSKEDRIILYDQAEAEVSASAPDKQIDFKSWSLFNRGKAAQIKDLARAKALKFVFCEWKNKSYELKFEQ